VTLPGGPGRDAIGFLLGEQYAERGDQLGREPDGLAAAFLDLTEHQAAALPLRTLRGVPGAARRAQALGTSHRADMPAAGLPGGLRTPLRSWPLVPPLAARGRIITPVRQDIR
jgi:hypothetical protein